MVARTGPMAPRMVKFRGEFRAINELAREHGINQDTVKFRLRSGWTIEDALTKPVARRAAEIPVAAAPAAPQRRLDGLWDLLEEAENVLLATVAVDMRRRRLIDRLRQAKANLG